ncbi:hypothetical protein F5X98DRAFT_337274 [Xylaria grammica]|nr:hypothetical protein F5X98DRAFT_337274 [Xylaria grammica]
MAYNTLEHELVLNNVVNSPILSRRNNRSLRLLRLQPAVISLFFSITFFVSWDPMPLIFICPLILWDLIDLARARNRFSAIPFEVNLLLELAFFGSFIYMVYFYLNKLIGTVPVSFRDLVLFSRREAIIAIPGWVLISLVSSVYIYLNIRAYPAHRRYTRDYHKIKPIIAFTETGNPIAVFPPLPEAELQRLSIDSLQEVHGEP